MPDSVTSIGSYCFNNCSALTSFTFSEGITTIPEHAFDGCTSLQTAVIPNYVTSIGAYAYYGCTALRDVELPPTLESIGIYAFYNDLAMNPVYIPISVNSIGGFAFNALSSVKLECYKDTYAAKYSYDNYINYTAIDLVKGDADNNGVTNIRDVTYIQLYRADLYEIGTDAKTVDRVDVTGDYKVTIRDATQIQLFRAGLIDSL